MDPVLIDAPAIRALDLRPLEIWSTQPLDALLSQGPVLELRFDWPRAQDDPRELPECPEPRLWALRADARYPWLPLLLERDQGSLIRHVALVVPHSFSRSEGLRFDPEALELWGDASIDAVGRSLPARARTPDAGQSLPDGRSPGLRAGCGILEPVGLTSQLSQSCRARLELSIARMMASPRRQRTSRAASN